MVIMLKDIIYNYLNENKVDAWIIYDYECNNPALVGLIGKRMLTRKCFMVFEKERSSYIICHLIDKVNLSDLATDFKIITYKTWDELLKIIAEKFSYTKVLMEISEDGLLPRSSTVDYGTVCLIKKYVKKVLSSADLLQHFSATINEEAFSLYQEACRLVDKIKDNAFDLIRNKIKNNEAISEYDVQQFILEEFKVNGMVTDSAPIVAVNEHAADPHYAPSEKEFKMINKGDLVLIDLWAKLDHPLGVFGDITWIGYVGNIIPDKIQEVFDIVRDSIEVTLNFLNQELPKRVVQGFEVDDICRNFIKEKGYGDFFIHRTGHSISIDESSHGKGVNIDNFETHDTRAIINNISFSIEPGIYLKEFGIREEIDVFVQDNQAFSMTKIQKGIIKLI